MNFNLSPLYGEKTTQAAARYQDLQALYTAHFGGAPQTFFSSPGRSEISGNHTDHNHGKVIAAAVDLDVIAAAAPSNDNLVRIQSVGYKEDRIDCNDLSPRASDVGKSRGLVRGVLRYLRDRGVKVGGFTAYTQSTIPSGSGLSSSAAFEVLIAEMINRFYANGTIDAVLRARAAQYAENVYFGKPCGLMDQLAVSYGGLCHIDFCDPAAPIITELPADFAAAGLRLCITNTGGSHADLTNDYAQIPAEMKQVAAAFGAKTLRELTCSPNDLLLSCRGAHCAPANPSTQPPVSPVGRGLPDAPPTPTESVGRGLAPAATPTESTPNGVGADSISARNPHTATIDGRLIAAPTTTVPLRRGDYQSPVQSPHTDASQSDRDSDPLHCQLSIVNCQLPPDRGALPDRAVPSDRALLRAYHYLTENIRVDQQADALHHGDYPRFLSLVNASGRSSALYLQNLYAQGRPDDQKLMLALAASETVLGGSGACRVHGGGFAGTIQAFVPENLTDLYKQTMDSLFGAGHCHILNIRPKGTVCL